MPKIEVNESLFWKLLGREYDAAGLEAILPVAKAELDEWSDQSLPEGERVLKIELNDTNRPDLWSTAGLARQLRLHAGAPIPSYPFFSREGEARDAGQLRVSVDPSVQKVRPYISAFVISGKPITEAMLKDIIQTQEKLCWNYGRKRKSIAMGVYRSAAMQFPVRYAAVDPDKTSFTPLGMDNEMSLRRILKEHPKGQEFGWILEGEKAFPFLTDASGEVLSMPPIINSASLGAVVPGDGELFVELTGSDLPSLCIATSIVACDFADSGYQIKSVRVDYPYDTPFGRSIVFPYYFQKPQACGLDRMARFLGKILNTAQAQAALTRMGVSSDAHGQYVQAFPPEYRNDFLHAADVMEDVMIGHGMENFEPERPRDFTIGRVTPVERLSRRVKDALVGQGFQEMIYNYLGSRTDFIDRMGIDGSALIRISNPMSENYEYVRNSPLPCLLETEAVSGKAAFPHRTFEVGKVVYRDAKENYGCKTRQFLGLLESHADADFNGMAAILNAVMFYLGMEYRLEEAQDPRFIPGRQARILSGSRDVGVFGEIHPQVLENWGLSVPAAAGELDLDSMIEAGA